MTRAKKQESGRSMIEMVGVLAVMGLITAGAFVLISSAMKSQKISHLDDDVSAIVAGTRLLYNSQEDFTGLSSDALEAIGFAGDNKNPYGGAYYVNVDTDTSKFLVGIGGLSAGEAKTLQGRGFPGGSTAVSCAAVSNGAWTSGDCDDTSNAVLITYDKVQAQ